MLLLGAETSHVTTCSVPTANSTRGYISHHRKRFPKSDGEQEKEWVYNSDDETETEPGFAQTEPKQIGATGSLVGVCNWVGNLFGKFPDGTETPKEEAPGKLKELLEALCGRPESMPAMAGPSLCDQVWAVMKS